MAINKTWLKAFHAVASAGSFSRAATERAVGQSTLSSQVAALENAYGVRLFDRSTRRVALTTIGERLLLLTGQMDAAEAEAERVLTGAHETDGGELRIGADRPALAVPLMARFSRTRPTVRMSFSVGNSTELEKAVEDQQLDLALVGRPLSSSRLSSKFLIDDPVYLITSTEHTLAASKSVSFLKLLSHTMIVRERGSRLREMIDEALLEIGGPNPRLIEVNDWQGAREFAAQNAGVAIVPKSEVGSFDPRLSVLAIKGAVKSLPAYIAFRVERVHHGVIGQFIKSAGIDATED